MFTLHFIMSGLPYFNKAMNTADKKYTIRTVLFMGAYAIMNIAAITGAFEGLRPSGAGAFALIVSAPICGQIWTHLAWMKESDEFIRALQAKRFIVAMGLAMAVASTWGFLELYAKAPHVSPAMLLPLFYLCFGISSPFIRTSH